MFDVITIGDSTLDTFLILAEDSPACTVQKAKKLLCLHYGDKIPIVDTEQSIGGNAANVAVGLSTLGYKTTIITELGDDVNGHVIFEGLQKADVDTRFVKQLSGQDTRYSIVLTFKAERTILSAHTKRNYTLPTLPVTQWLYYTSLSATFENIQEKIIAHLKKNPTVKLAVNPGSFQYSSGGAAIKKILPLTNVLFVNKDEAEILCGKKMPIKPTMRALHAMGVKIVSITDGENGSFASDGMQILSMPIYPTRPVAKTGAGDGFASGFLGALLKDRPLAEAMQWGTANAAGVVGHVGAQKGLLSQKKLASMIATYKKIVPTSF